MTMLIGAALVAGPSPFDLTEGIIVAVCALAIFGLVCWTLRRERK